jgi:hypothetical protein
MKKVGYPVPQNSIVLNNEEGGNVVKSKFGSITNEEELELFNYLKFIRQRKTR